MSDDPHPDPANSLSQMKRGVLELCILGLLDRQPTYGYQIVKHLTALPGLVTSEGTVYPLLSRLKAQQLIVSELTDSSQGPPRRTYVLTPAGRKYLRSLRGVWQEVVGAVDLCVNTSTPLEKSR
jgi:PadR family transcriptional regulator PadR